MSVEDNHIPPREPRRVRRFFRQLKNDAEAALSTAKIELLNGAAVTQFRQDEYSFEPKHEIFAHSFIKKAGGKMLISTVNRGNEEVLKAEYTVPDDPSISEQTAEFDLGLGRELLIRYVRIDDSICKISFAYSVAYH
jgi:hypothetical protein